MVVLPGFEQGWEALVGELSFEGRVAVVTGAGRGIGRAHATLLASRGATVVVNDLGVAIDGIGGSPSPAREVVAEIGASGGTAVVDINTVATEAGANAVIANALDTFGRVDILIHNAGLGMKATSEAMLSVHLRAGMWLTEAAWGPMEQKGYGRILLTTSSIGLFGLDMAPGNSAMLSYGAAKMGLVGLMRNLALRGAGSNIRVNALAPGALTRLALEGLGAVPEAVRPDMSSMTPELVAAAAAWLVHEDCPATGEVIAANGGRVTRIFIAETQGWRNPALTPELVRDNFGRICDEAGYVVPVDSTESPQ